jgi:hypothetical protein
MVTLVAVMVNDGVAASPFALLRAKLAVKINQKQTTRRRLCMAATFQQEVL